MGSRGDGQSGSSGNAVVASCRSLRRSQVWVTWLGYEPEYSCWVDVGAFRFGCGCEDGALPGIDAPKLLASAVLVDEPLAGSSMGSSAGVAASAGSGASGESGVFFEVLTGLPPGASAEGADDAATVAAVGRGKKRRTGWLGPSRRGPKKKAVKKVYETKVHTIRVGRDGVTEVREVLKRWSGKGAAGKSGGGGGVAAVAEAGEADVEDAGEGEVAGEEGSPSHCLRSEIPPPLLSVPSSLSSSSSTNERSDGDAIGTGSSANGCGGDGDGVEGGGAFADDASALWTQHRLLNAHALKRPYGLTFRVEVTSHTAEEVRTHPPRHPRPAPSSHP